MNYTYLRNTLLDMFGPYIMKTIPTEINPTLITCINCSLNLVTTCEGVGGRVTTHAPTVALFPQSLTGPIRVHTQNVSGVGECVTYTVYHVPTSLCRQ